MSTRNTLLSSCILILLPSTLYANAGTLLIWAQMLHLVFGNILIGLIEGLLLSKFYKTSKWKSILIMILANYASAWLGSLLFTYNLISPIQITINNLNYWFLIFILIAFVFTLLIEYIFILFIINKSTDKRKQALSATVFVNCISY